MGKVESGGVLLSPSSPHRGKQGLATDSHTAFLPLVQSPLPGGGGAGGSTAWEEATTRADIPDDSQAGNAWRRGGCSGTAPCSAVEEDPGPGGQGGEGKAEGQEAEPKRGSGLETGSRMGGEVTERGLREARQRASPLPSWS